MITFHIQAVLKNHEPSCLHACFFKSEDSQSVSEIKQIIANMPPQSSLNDQQFFEFVCVLNKKDNPHDSKDNKALLHELTLLIPFVEYGVIKSLPSDPLFFNAENMATIMTAKNPNLFLSILLDLKQLSNAYHLIMGSDYICLGEKIEQLRSVARCSVDDSALQFYAILDNTKTDIRKKISSAGEPEHKSALPIESIEESHHLSMKH